MPGTTGALLSFLGFFAEHSVAKDTSGYCSVHCRHPDSYSDNNRYKILMLAFSNNHVKIKTPEIFGITLKPEIRLK